MKALTEQVITRLHKPFFSRTELDVWVKGSVHRRDALLRRAMAAGEVARIRRGLYVVCPPYAKQKPDPLVLAQHVYGPSYISMESALAFHGWIPEAVYTVVSVSLNRSRIFDTPVGRFEFVRIPQRTFYSGVDRIELPEMSGTVFMANPLKALADLVYARRLDEMPETLLNSLRIDSESLEAVTVAQVDELAGNYPVERVERFLQQMRGRSSK
jgi:hypothetical protein